MKGIGSTLKYSYLDDNDDYLTEEFTVGGYVYYDSDLFYVCYNDAGKQIDIYDAFNDDEDEDAD